MYFFHKQNLNVRNDLKKGSVFICTANMYPANIQLLGERSSTAVDYLFSIVIDFEASYQPMPLSTYTCTRLTDDHPMVLSVRSPGDNPGIFRQLTRGRCQRDGKDEYAYEHSIKWQDNERRAPILSRRPNIFDRCGIRRGARPQRTIGLIPFSADVRRS